MLKLPSLHRHMRPALAAALLLLGAACVGGYESASVGVVWVSNGPPPPRHEVIVVSPGPDYFWIEGYWVWTGVAYDWTPGHWERRPSPRARYERGRWRHERRGWYYVPGRWRDDDHDRGRRGHGREKD